MMNDLMLNLMKDLDAKKDLDTKKPKDCSWGILITCVICLGMLGNAKLSEIATNVFALIFVGGCIVYYIKNCYLPLDKYKQENNILWNRILETSTKIYEYKASNLELYMKARKETNFDVEERLIDAFDPVNIQKAQQAQQAAALASIATITAGFLIANKLSSKLVGNGTEFKVHTDPVKSRFLPW